MFLSNSVRRPISSFTSGRSAVLFVACGLVLATAFYFTRTARAANFTSTQSGSWGSAATWGGAGVPGCNDDVTIANTHNVTLDANRCANNLTLNSGGTLDLSGFEMNFSGNNVTFTNNGTFTNSGSFNRLVSANGGAQQTIAGTGTYSGNLKLENFSVTWNIAAGTTFTFNSATNNVNIQIDNTATSNLNVTSPLAVIAPSSGANYVIVDKQGGFIGGVGGVRTQGNVRLKGTTDISVPVETVSGAAQADGYFGSGWRVDTGASLSQSGAVSISDLNGGSGLTIASGATVDLAGNQLNIAFNGPFTNNGTVNNSGAFSRIVFMDNGTHAVSGIGNYSGNVGLEIFNNTTNITVGSSLTFGAPAGNTNILVDAPATLNFTGPGSLTLSGSVSNSGAIRFNEAGPACGDANRIVIRSSVAGTQRAWTGGGQYVMKNLDVRDQAGTSTIVVAGGLNAGNNGANWSFTLCLVSRADFDGDGKTDISIFRPSDGNWWSNRTGTGLNGQHWGATGDIPVPGDYDNDGRTDLAVFRADANPANTDFFILNSSTFTVSGYSWGLPGDIPISGDFNGDGRTDITVFRPSSNTWYILNSGTFTNTIETFGSAGDVPMAMDPEADGRSNIAVFRPSNGTWYIAKPTGPPATNFYAIPFGLSTDMPVPADYDGDNKDDVAVFRPSNGTWYILRSSNGSVDSRPFGASGDVPAPGDYDGDGTDDVAVFRNGIWYVNRSTGGFFAAGFGLATDIPIPKKYIP